MRGLTALALLLSVSLGCEDRSYRDIGAEINILTKRSDALVGPARDRLAGFHRRAIPQIETALHTASPTGKLNLIAALSAIHDEETVPILRHFAIYDSKAEIRNACEGLLKGWAVAPGPLGDAARAAIARMTDKRARGEGPLGVNPVVAK